LTKKETFELNTLASIENSDNKQIASLLSKDTYPGFMVDDFFSYDECIRLRDPERKYNKFLDLTSHSFGSKFLLVPWFENIEEKANSYKTYLLKNNKSS
jgi:hypothetical protein